jgi:tetratricopeptide (TPR) repeat protein
MRGILIGLALSLIVLPAWAQSNRDECSKDNTDPDLSIRGCTALIQSGQETNENLAIDYYNGGVSYDQKGLYDQEIADDNQAIALKPGYAEAYNNRAWAYHMKGMDAQGLPDANKAIALNPKDGDAFETRAEIYEKLGQRGQAIADYREALELNPNDKDSQAGLKRLGVTP